ncbi:MAG: hypothetical protein ACO1QS_17640 [Verrucomicrobiota bacterium]
MLVLEELCDSQQRDCSKHLCVSDCFDQANYPEKFTEEYKKMARDFVSVTRLVAAEIGQPVFVGKTDDEKAPAWAKTGHLVAYWVYRMERQLEEWRIYLIIRHVGHEMPLELILGAVCNPKEDWHA